MTIQIRPLAAAEAGHAAQMVGALIAELAPDHEPDVAAMARTAEGLLGQGRILGLVAWESDQPVGLLMLNECAAIYAGGLFAEITELYVIPRLRSRGLAAQMVAQARDIGKARGWKRLEVGAPQQPVWARTKAFYVRQGFTEVGPRLKCSI